ncbi:hypothetical protein [Synechococcus elongatus]
MASAEKGTAGKPADGIERAIAPLLTGATATVHWEARQLCTDLNR